MTLPTPHNCLNDDDFDATNTNSASDNNNNTTPIKTNGDEIIRNNQNNNNSMGEEDDYLDIFGPPRSSPMMRLNRPRVPMISAKLRLREERKRILQLCAHKLEKIKDSETNLRRSVCINNTYSRLANEVRREKQSRYLPKCETKIDPDLDDTDRMCSVEASCRQSSRLTVPNQPNLNCYEMNNNIHHNTNNNHNRCSNSSHRFKENCRPLTPINPSPKARKRSHADADLETLDREINALDAAMPPIDPELTQGAEQLERALVSRKRTRMEEEHDRLVKEALSQFYLPSPRLISGIDDDCPTPPLNLDMKRQKLMTSSFGIGGSGPDSTIVDLDLNLDSLNQNTQREFEVIMETLRLGGTNVVAGSGNGVLNNQSDSCGQAAMMSEQGVVFHNLVIASLET